ncbi:DUF58 domain-containing protein [Brevibacillus panacihumi]|uniref:DUF58 domain-containing protein n=1 Tax=Brevibacillus panacihumi TaxID=497735 RepID=A0A3M8CN89_9BACL|nr:DUF58 domain-containing protein [Brevibacillus panacihumi]RNB77206.1 DUF58 domain-containing protein [Brevibacillus panacihumi]
MRQQKWGKFNVIALVLVTYVFAMFQGGFASWFLFYSSLVFFVYECLAYYLMFATLEVVRHLDRNRLQEGEDVVVTIRLRRRIWFPLGWNMVIEALPERLVGFYEPHKQLIFPWFKREVEFRYVIPQLPRGYYRLQESVICGGDFFGFIERRKVISLADDILVYPSYQHVNHWPLGDGSFSGTIHVSHRRSDDVAAVRGVREYQRGDRLSQIHWRASARGTGLKTKEFEHQAMNQAVFFLDVEKNSYPASDLFELAVKVTASLIAYANRNQYHYGLVFKQKERMSIDPGLSHAHFLRVFDQLARVMPEGSDSFSRLIGREALEQSQGVTLMMVTPRLDKELVARLVSLVQRGRRVQLFHISRTGAYTAEQKQVLRLLAANKVVCTSIHTQDYHQWKRMGGA